MTVAHAVSAFIPASGDIIQGLNILDNLYEKVIYGTLPEGQDWIDHLDILDAVRIGSFGGLKKIQQYYPELLPGYVDVGIEKNSTDHKKAIELLQHNGLPRDVLVDHALNDSFVRINVPRRDGIRSFQLHRLKVEIGGVIFCPEPISEIQFSSINSIYDLYNQDTNLRNKNIEAFISEWDKRSNLKKLRQWWDAIPGVFQITSVGKVLAHSNAQRCDKSLPPLA